MTVTRRMRRRALALVAAAVLLVVVALTACSARGGRGGVGGDTNAGSGVPTQQVTRGGSGAQNQAANDVVSADNEMQAISAALDDAQAGAAQDFSAQDNEALP